jgi:hypothetical protein
LDLSELLCFASEQEKPIQVATVSGEQHRLKALDSAVSLQLAVEFHRFLKQLHRLSLATHNSTIPAYEKYSISHWCLLMILNCCYPVR